VKQKSGGKKAEGKISSETEALLVRWSCNICRRSNKLGILHNSITLVRGTRLISEDIDTVHSPDTVGIAIHCAQLLRDKMELRTAKKPLTSHQCVLNSQKFAAFNFLKPASFLHLASNKVR